MAIVILLFPGNWNDCLARYGLKCGARLYNGIGYTSPPACQSEGMTVRSFVAFNAVLRICPQSPLMVNTIRAIGAGMIFASTNVEA